MTYEEITEKFRLLSLNQPEWQQRREAMNVAFGVMVRVTLFAGNASVL